MTKTRDLLLHPIALAALGLLLANDHWLKWHVAGWVTGKLSDAAGLVVFPLFAVVALDACVRLPRRWTTIAAMTFSTVSLFALVKCIPAFTEAYRVGLGVVQWPLRQTFVRVEAVTDPTDLVAIPFSALVFVVSRKWISNSGARVSEAHAKG